MVLLTIPYRIPNYVKMSLLWTLFLISYDLSGTIVIQRRPLSGFRCRVCCLSSDKSTGRYRELPVTLSARWLQMQNPGQNRNLGSLIILLQDCEMVPLIVSNTVLTYSKFVLFIHIVFYITSKAIYMWQRRVASCTLD